MIEELENFPEILPIKNLDLRDEDGPKEKYAFIALARVYSGCLRF